MLFPKVRISERVAVTGTEFWLQCPGMGLGPIISKWHHIYPISKKKIKGKGSNNAVLIMAMAITLSYSNSKPGSGFRLKSYIYYVKAVWPWQSCWTYLGLFSPLKMRTQE